MYLKHLVFLAALLVVAYAAIEPLDVAAADEAAQRELEVAGETAPEGDQHVRQKRFLLLGKALLAKKALAIGAVGAVGLGAGLGAGLAAKSLYDGGGYYPQPVVVRSYPVYYDYPVAYSPGYGYGGYGHGGYAGASAYASASAW